MTLHLYLSMEWRDAAAEIRRRFIARETIDVPLVANVTVEGAPFDPSTLELHTLPGIPQVMEPGHVDDADVEITLQYDLARLILLDTGTNVLQLGLDSGQIVVDGDVEKLRRHWRTNIGDEAYVALLDELRAITR